MRNMAFDGDKGRRSTLPSPGRVHTMNDDLAVFAVNKWLLLW
jgi:hypothetical protein